MIKLYRKIIFQFIVVFLGVLITSCSSSSTDADNEYAGIVIPDSDKVDCCTSGQEEATRAFLYGLHKVEKLSGIKVGKYRLMVYASDSALHIGYNDLYFTVAKGGTGNHVRYVSFSGLTPIMDMGGKMKHSTPLGRDFAQVDSFPVYHTWVSFLMASDSIDNNNWSLSYNYTIWGTGGSLKDQAFDVDSLPSGQEWLKSFKYNDSTYFLSLVGAGKFKTGVNAIEAYVSKKSSDITEPYPEASEKFTIEIVPTMPDMNNHTSPNNVALTRQDNGIYQGQLNLTMTGLWRIHLVVKDALGNVIAGGEKGTDGYSILYWTVTI